MIRSEGTQLMEYSPKVLRRSGPWASHPTSVERVAIQRPRSALRIRLDILEALRDEGPSKANRIILVANLAHDRFAKCLGDLSSQGLLTESQDNGRSYALTPKGLEFVNHLEEVQAFLAGLGLGL